MDGRFVPNITFGPGIVSAIRKATAKHLNLHLMIVEPEHFIADFVKSGADSIVVQAESSSTIHLHRVLGQIRSLGKQAGVALNPASPPGLVDYVLHLFDVVKVVLTARKPDIVAGVEAGADVFVAGSYIFDAPDYAERIASLRRGAASARSVEGSR